MQVRQEHQRPVPPQNNAPVLSQFLPGPKQRHWVENIRSQLGQKLVSRITLKGQCHRSHHCQIHRIDQVFIKPGVSCFFYPVHQTRATTEAGLSQVIVQHPDVLHVKKKGPHLLLIMGYCALVPTVQSQETPV